MAEPSKKSEEITQFLQKTFNRTESIKSDICVSCGKQATQFRNDLSKREYTISGLCQSCQDSVFDLD
jgi:hypothetical protein